MAIEERRQQVIRWTDIAQLWCVGFGLIFAVTVVALGQSQDSINATVMERIANINIRLDRMENYLTAAIVALISNLVAHIVNIKTSRGNRRG